MWDKSERSDGTFSRSDFVFDAASNNYTCPGGNILQIVPPTLQHAADRLY
jgi:hypothetical protein